MVLPAEEASVSSLGWWDPLIVKGFVMVGLVSESGHGAASQEKGFSNNYSLSRTDKVGILRRFP
jgi:hypothetical protein